MHFDQGFGDPLPYPDASFDRVLSSFMFHHLPPDEKRNTLREVRRVLKPTGEFHMADFEGPDDGAPRFVARLLHFHSHMKENSASLVLGIMRQAGFGDPQKVGRRTTAFAGVAYYRAAASRC